MIDPIRKLHQVVLGILVLSWASIGNPEEAKTTISIHNAQWYLNDSITYAHTKAEGLLMNVRMVNATFEDRFSSSFDSQKNTQDFIQSIPSYVAQGVRAFTFNLQGGMPGYERATNSAYRSDGTLRPEYMQRVKDVIEACDRNGCAVILGCFYQRQDQQLTDDIAVRIAIVHTIQWIENQGFKNVVLEIANEYSHDGFDHPIIQSTQGELELIRLAKRTAPELLVSTSGLGDGQCDESIAKEVDFILVHYNGTPVEQIAERIQTLKKFRKPIVCNEDDKTGEEAVRAAQASVENGASWGYMNKEINQYMPFHYNGPSDDPVLYARLKKLTQENTNGETTN